MSSEETATPESRAQIFAWILGILGLILVVYPMSVGPAIWMQRHDWVSLNTLISIYGPLESFAKACPPVDQFFRWYVQFWS